MSLSIKMLSDTTCPLTVRPAGPHCPAFGPGSGVRAEFLSLPLKSWSNLDYFLCPHCLTVCPPSLMRWLPFTQFAPVTPLQYAGDPRGLRNACLELIPRQPSLVLMPSESLTNFTSRFHS